MQKIRQKFKQTTSTRKGRIIVSGIALVLIMGIAGGLVYWQTHKKMIIREKLESAIEEKSGGFYNIKYESLDLDEVTGFLSITNLEIGYDSTKLGTMRQLGLIPPTLLNIKVPQITVEGVKTPRAIIDKEIAGRKLEIRNPAIEIIYTLQGKDSARNVPPEEVYRQILGNLNMISLDTVLISGATITTSHLKKTSEHGITASNLSLQLIDVKVDSVSSEDKSRVLFSKSITASLEKFEWFSTNKLYRYGINNLVVSSNDRKAQIASFQIEPQKGEDAFVKSLRTQDDRFDFTFRDIVLNDIDINQLLIEEFTAENMIIGSASLKIYRDLNIPRDKKNRVGDYPHQVMDEIPIPIAIKQIAVNNAFLEYKERNNITKNAGKVQFYNISATIRNFTNDKELLAKNNIMTADVDSRFMNKTPFKSTWTFYMNNSNGRFDIKGNLGSIDAEDLNALTEPMGPARIENGTIKGVSFDLKGNDYSMNGNVRMLYEDLKVAVLEKDKGAKEWDKKSLTSFIANILIKNSNPKDDDEEARVMTITYPRDTNRSMFNVAWKTLFKGIKETVGIKK